MITLTTPNSNPASTSGLKCIKGEPAINTKLPSQEEIDFCFCAYECMYKELAFVNINDTSKKDENDFASPLIEVPDVNGSVIFYIITPQGEEVEIVDDSFGGLFPLGFNNDNNNKAGTIIQWHIVQSVYGFGDYKIKALITSFGVETEVISHIYSVQQFNIIRADGTVVINTKPDGYIENGIDYRYINWERQTRIRGIMKLGDPVKEETYYPNVNWEETQNQVRVHETWDLQLILIPIEIYRPLIKDWLLSNGVYMSDYNIFNADKNIRYKKIKWDESETPQTYVNNSKITFNITLSEVDRGTLKRQF